MKLTAREIQKFIEDGFVKIENAFSEETAQKGRQILWADTGCDPDDPSTWVKPVIRLGAYSQKPFREAANSPRLQASFDQLVGEGNWIPGNSLGTFPIRFPGKEEPNDTGWHVDAGFPGENPYDFMTWRINVYSKGRGLLMLFLFSDITAKDAPTRIRKGSHVEVAKILYPHGDEGLSFMELAAKLEGTESCEQALATGKAGTVYLCHPFLVHAAQSHQGANPRFLAQPPLYLKDQLLLNRPDQKYTAVELAVLKGIATP